METPGAIAEDRFLPIEKRLVRLSMGSLRGFLVLRLILAAALFLEVMAPGPASWPRWLAIVPAAYACAAFAIYFLRTEGRLTDALSLGSFLLDVLAGALVLYATEGAGSDSFFTAMLLLIMGSFLLQRPIVTLSISIAVGLGYAALAPPPAAGFLHFSMLRLSLFLLIALFSVHIADYAAWIERQTATRYEERLAWMQRLSLVGKGMAAVLHEAKTPLGTIVLNAESAAQSLREGHDAGEELRVIKEEAEHAHAILQNFLDFVKPAPLDLEPLDAREPLLKALDMAKVRLEERKVELEAATRDDCRVRGSRRHLLQAFANIINNAVDAMPSGGKLLVSMDKGRGRARILFKDTGVGMTPETQERLFEPFASGKADNGGHGLGLGIVRWILQEHGGDVEVRSAGPGKGSQVTLTLPLA